jgi:hypothetical protein
MIRSGARLNYFVHRPWPVASAPAHGRWSSKGSTKRDDMIIVEVMTEHFDLAWWKKYRAALERAFRQDEIVIRAHDIIQV